MKRENFFIFCNSGLILRLKSHNIFCVKRQYIYDTEEKDLYPNAILVCKQNNTTFQLICYNREWRYVLTENKKAAMHVIFCP